MAAGTYDYPDTSDRITRRFVSDSEPYPGYWAISDERAMSRAAAKLKTVLGPKPEVRALDAGCGFGRMLPWLSRLAGRIVAIDPDAGRLADAARVAPGLGDGTEVELVRSDVRTLPEDTFDLVLCSHIIQHIPTTEVTPFLSRLHRLTAPGGVLVLVYTRAPVGDEKYSVDHLGDHGVETRWVSREEFDEVARGGGRERLPIHHRDPARLAELGRSLGWTELWSWSFHVLDDRPEFDGADDRDEVVNATPGLLRCSGRDAVTLWQRREPR